MTSLIFDDEHHNGMVDCLNIQKERDCIGFPSLKMFGD